MPDSTLLDALTRQALALRELADGMLHTIAAIKGTQPKGPETPEGSSALKKVQTFDSEHKLPQ